MLIIFQHEHHAKTFSHAYGFGKERLDLLGQRVGGDVEILGRDAAQFIAHTAAHQPRFVTGGVQRAENVESDVA